MTDYNPPTQIPAPGQIIQIEGEPFHRVFAHAEKHGVWWAISRDAKSDILWPETITGWLPITHPPVKIGEEPGEEFVGLKSHDGSWTCEPVKAVCMSRFSKTAGLHRVRIIDLGPVEPPEKIVELSCCATALTWQNEAPAGTRRELRPRFNQPWKHYGPGDSIPVEDVLSTAWQGREVKA